MGTIRYGGRAARPRDTSFTQDVAERGLAAIRDRRAAANVTSRTDWESAWDQLQNPYMGSVDSGGWQDARGINNMDYALAYGQTDEGKYAGFKNASDLKAAVLGFAEYQRDQDRMMAESMAQMANDRLDALDRQYNERYMDARTSATDDVDMGDDGGYGDLYGSGQSQAAGEKMGERITDEMDPKVDGLDKWYGSTAAPYLSALETMQQIQQAPISDYASLAGQKYGVDPFIVRGWYPDSKDVSDFRTQRDMESIDQYGMPFSEAESTNRRLIRDDEQAMQDQQDADRQAALDYLAETMQMDPEAFLSETDTTLEQALDAVNSADFQQYSQDIEALMADGNYNGAGDLLAGLEFVDPELYRILAMQYGTVISDNEG